MTAVEVVGRYVDVGGVKTYYESAGDGEGMLCMHTSGRDCRQWHPYLQHYGTRYRVVAPDMPGHQKSSPLPGHRCIDNAKDYAEFLWEFASAVGLTRPIVMGCSVGGNIVFPLAQDHPSEVKALISFQGAAYSPRASPHELLRHPQIHIGQFLCDRAVGLSGSRAPQEVKEFIAWTGLQMTQEAQQADMAVYADFDVRSDMGKIACPCLVIRGTDDWIVTQEMVDETVGALTNAQFVKTYYPQGLGHMSHMEGSKECMRVIDDFLETVESDSH